MSEKSRLLKNTGLIAVGNFGAKMISFILLPLYTSILSTAEYGTYDYIVAVSAFLLPIITLSIHESMFRFIIDAKKEKNEFKQIITNAFFIVVLGIVLVGTIIFGIHILFPNISNLSYIFLYVTANALYIFSNNILRGQGKIKEFAIISSSKNILQLFLNVLSVAVFKLGMKGLIISTIIAEIIPFFVIIFVFKTYKQINFKNFSKKGLKPMLKYSIPLIPNSLGAQIINISDRLVISSVLGTSANGIYSVAYKFPNVIETVYHFFYIAWSESASRVFSKGKEEANKYYKSLHKIINNFVFSIILILIAGMPILFRIFINGDYSQGIKYVSILLIAMYLNCLAKFYSGLFTALKQTKILAISTVVAAMINLIVNIVFIKYIGLYAAAISTLISEIVLVIIQYKHIYKNFDFKIDYKKILIEFLILVMVLILFDNNNYFKIGISLAISIIYAIIVNKQLINMSLKKFINKINKNKE